MTRKGGAVSWSPVALWKSSSGLGVTSTVNIIPVNDAPILDLDSSDPLSTGFSTTALEQVETPIVAVTGLMLTDVDSSSLVQCRA